MQRFNWSIAMSKYRNLVVATLVAFTFTIVTFAPSTALAGPYEDCVGNCNGGDPDNLVICLGGCTPLKGVKPPAEMCNCPKLGIKIPCGQVTDAKCKKASSTLPSLDHKCWNGKMVAKAADCPPKPGGKDPVVNDDGCGENEEKKGGKCVCMDGFVPLHCTEGGRCVAVCTDGKVHDNDGNCVNICKMGETLDKDGNCAECQGDCPECAECEDPCPAAVAMGEKHATWLKVLSGLCFLILLLLLILLFGGKEKLEAWREKRAADKAKENPDKVTPATEGEDLPVVVDVETPADDEEKPEVAPPPPFPEPEPEPKPKE